MWSNHNDFSQRDEPGVDCGVRNRRLATIIVMAVLTSFETILVSTILIIRTSYGPVWASAQQLLPKGLPILILLLTVLSVASAATALRLQKQQFRRIMMFVFVALSFASAAAMIFFWFSRVKNDSADAVWSALLPVLITLGGNQAILGIAVSGHLVGTSTPKSNDITNIILLSGFLLISEMILFAAVWL